MGKGQASGGGTKVRGKKLSYSTLPARPPATPGRDWRTWGTVAAMLLAVIAVYFPIASKPGDNALWGGDFYELHLYRIRFAQSALFGPHPHLPGWYPRELLGAPFWSNVQSFPFLPTRLILLGLDPITLFPVAVNLGACLSALFTFLYARRIGLSRLAAAVAGWTFACAGFYASRVMAGHLPLLEVYCGLPLLFWLIERYRAADTPRQRSWALLALGVACACLALAGHPQLPLYAGAAGLIYLLIRARGRGALRGAATMAAGAACAAFALWPMLLLIGRSTRVLALDPPANDIVFPYSRLLVFVSPWSQGWPAAVPRTPVVPVAFPNDAYFWDTMDYVGLLPLAAAAFLLVRAAVRRERPKGPWAFLALLGAAGLLLALPAARAPFTHLPGTFLRSPARLVYFTEFALAMGLGLAIERAVAWARTSRQSWVLPALALVLVGHALDLGRHDRYFIRLVAYHGTPSPREEQFAQTVRAHAGRVAIDVGLLTPLNRELDDIGLFDSIALAKPYRAIFDMADLSPRLNSQYIDGSDLNLRALSTCGVMFVVTNKTPGGPPPTAANPIRVFPIRDPGQRVQFFPDASVQFTDVETTHRNLRDPRFDLRHRLMLPPNTRPAGNDVTPAGGAPPPIGRPAEFQYSPEADDQITTGVKSDQPGYVLLLDAWDPGWHATVDGAPAPVQIADDVFMAIHVPAGAHAIRVNFSTPGAVTGLLLSGAGILLLAGLSFGPLLVSGRQRDETDA